MPLPLVKVVLDAEEESGGVGGQSARGGTAVDGGPSRPTALLPLSVPLQVVACVSMRHRPRIGRWIGG